MINKELEDIKPEDLQNLIINGVSESKTIEYKSELPLNTGDANMETGTLLKRLNVRSG